MGNDAFKPIRESTGPEAMPTPSKMRRKRNSIREKKITIQKLLQSPITEKVI